MHFEIEVSYLGPYYELMNVGRGLKSAIPFVLKQVQVENEFLN